MSVLDRMNKLLGDPNEKELKKLRPIVQKVRELQQSASIQALKREDLPKKTEELKKRIANGETLDAILPEAFAVHIRACELLQGETLTIGKQEFIWNMVPFDVQIIGAAALHRGCIAEMKTGEGKTLVSTMAIYLNALTAKGVHVVTVNDYLARRDAEWMGLLYSTLGLTVGTVLHGKNSEERKEAYSADITYGTNNEFGFDYLRDNMASSKKNQVQRGLYFAIVDEVDSILIDEARTPLIISQPGAQSTEKYGQYAELVRHLQENEHFNKDEKQKTAVLSEEGIKKMEQLLGIENIYTDKGFEEVHHIEQALRAHAIYQKDTDYVVQEGQIVIVDEFTGRLMPGRRYGHGLHQAIEAKEGVTVQRESKTLATITFQNYFRLYQKLAGMTGTAKTEEEEFESIYKLRTVVVPTNKPIARADKPDIIYRTMLAKFRAVAAVAKGRHEKGQPILIGTTSIEKSEVLGKLLEQAGVPHNVLNAKNHAKEADIVAEAGQKGAVTIATNMAGRGTDIKLGEGVKELGGLCILGTERHESRRIDNQLRGRAGRQGDPGESLFFISMEDELMRLFSGDRLKNMMERLNVPEDQPLQNRLVSNSIEGAQKRVEGHHFDMRKHVLQYDNVMNKHREIMYKRRQGILDKLAEETAGNELRATDQDEAGSPKPEASNALHKDILQSMRTEAENIVSSHAAAIDSDEWDYKEMAETVAVLHPQFRDFLSEEKLKAYTGKEELSAFIADTIVGFYKKKCTQIDTDAVAQAERVVTLRSIDTHWMDHIDDMSHLREQVAFSGFAQRNPLIEYQDQAFRKFRQLLRNIENEIIRMLLQIDFAQFIPKKVLEEAAAELQNLQTNENEIEGDLEQTGVQRSMPTGNGILAQAMRRQATGNGQQSVVSSRQADSKIGSGPTVIKADPPAQTSASGNSKKVGRNDPCPCGSGKKYKKCHGAEM